MRAWASVQEASVEDAQGDLEDAMAARVAAEASLASAERRGYVDAAFEYAL